MMKTWGKDIPCLYIITDEDIPNTPNSINIGNYSYDQLTMKSYLMWEFAFNHFGADKKWFIKIDDDSYLFYDNLFSKLSSLDFEKPHVLGEVTGSINKDWIQGGPGIVLSRDSLEKLIHDLDQNPEQKQFFQEYPLGEDVAISKAFKRMKISLTDVSGFYSTSRCSFRDMENTIAIHPIKPISMRVLHLVTKFRGTFPYRLFGFFVSMRFLKGKYGIRTKFLAFFKIKRKPKNK